MRNQGKADAIDTFNRKSCELKSQECLQNKLDRRLPMQFALIKNKTKIFAIKNELTVEFIFE